MGLMKEYLMKIIEVLGVWGRSARNVAARLWFQGISCAKQIPWGQLRHRLEKGPQVVLRGIARGWQWITANLKAGLSSIVGYLGRYREIRWSGPGIGLALRDKQLRWLLLVPLALVLLVTSAGFGSYMALSMLDPVGPQSSGVVSVDIPSGSGAHRIASILHEAGLVKHPLAFRLFVKYYGKDNLLKPGEYQLSPAMTVAEITEEIIRGNVVTYPFTIREGYTVEQIAYHLDDLGFADAETFLTLARSREEWDYRFIQGIPEGVEEPLEGYLFPDTYRIPRGTGEWDIINMMLKHFESVWNPLFDERMEEMGLTQHDIVTLASIVQKEAGNSAEMPLVSSAFHNRLNVGMKLRSCATVNYVLPEPRPILTTEDTQIDSPYNTYINGGLPPGPIGNPGEEAIRAALYPADTDYFYFVAKGDGSSHFSETLWEHLQAVNKYLGGN